MLSLNLAKIREAHERFEQVYGPEQLGSSDDALRVAAPVTLAFDIYKDKDQFRLVGSVQTDAGTAVQPLPRAVHVAGRPVVRPAVSAARP